MQSSLPPTPCSGCQSLNPVGQRYCGNCGQPLTPTLQNIDSLVERQVKREMEARLKDQKVVAVEIAESVYDRVSKWAKIFVVLLTLPLGAAIYFVYGQYSSLSELVKSSRSEAERILAGDTRKAKEIEGTVGAADRKAQALNSRIEAQGKTLEGLDSKVNLAQTRIAGYERTIQGYEARISKSGADALGQFESIKKTGNTALEEIGHLRDVVERQQKELAENGALVKELASRSLLEGFKTGQVPEDFITITRTPLSHVLAMRLKKTPYPETVRLQWFVAVQPPDSYVVIGNVVILPYWEDSIEKLSQRSMFVSYLADANPSVGTPFVKALSQKDNALYGDGKVLLPALPPRKQ
jgi:hypothetical protein